MITIFKKENMKNPFKRIKELLSINQLLSERLHTLGKENKTLRIENEALEKRVGDPAEVIKKLLGRPLKWKDISSMNDVNKRTYYLGAKQVLENETFKSEFDHFTYDLINDIAKNATDYQQVLNRRFTLNALYALKERLEGVPMVEDLEEDTDEELSEAI